MTSGNGYLLFHKPVDILTTVHVWAWEMRGAETTKGEKDKEATHKELLTSLHCCVISLGCWRNPQVTQVLKTLL